MQRVVLNYTPLSAVLQVFFLVLVLFSILTDSLDERLESTLNKFIKQKQRVGRKAMENGLDKVAE